MLFYSIDNRFLMFLSECLRLRYIVSFDGSLINVEEVPMHLTLIPDIYACYMEVPITSAANFVFRGGTKPIGVEDHLPP